MLLAGSEMIVIISRFVIRFFFRSPEKMTTSSCPVFICRLSSSFILPFHWLCVDDHLALLCYCCSEKKREEPSSVSLSLSRFCDVRVIIPGKRGEGWEDWRGGRRHGQPRVPIARCKHWRRGRGEKGTLERGRRSKAWAIHQNKIYKKKRTNERTKLSSGFLFNTFWPARRRILSLIACVRVCVGPWLPKDSFL